MKSAALLCGIRMQAALAIPPTCHVFSVIDAIIAAKGLLGTKTDRALLNTIIRGFSLKKMR
jgi:hypothetical protein